MGKKPISEQSWYTCLKELQKAKVMEKLSKGQYFINVYAMWKDDKNKRIEYIKAEKGEGGQRFAYNPLQLLIPKDIPTPEEVADTVVNVITDEEIADIMAEEYRKELADSLNNPA